jgi:hypothetical protein
MNTRVEETNTTNSTSSNGSTLTNAMDATGSLVTNAVDAMVRWPMRMTGATMDVMLQGMQRMTNNSNQQGSQRSASYSSGGYNSGYNSAQAGSGGSSWDLGASSSSSNQSSSGQGQSGQSWSSWLSGNGDQDLSGDDLKYVIWSIVFTKPGYECVLEPQHEEIVNYNADSSTFAAVKIAKFLDKTRHGRSEKPEAWGDRYPVESNKGARRSESTTIIATPESTTVSASSSGAKNSQSSASSQNEHDKGWRIPPEDQKFITLLYRVDRRLPRQEETVRVDRVTVERGTRVV